MSSIIKAISQKWAIANDFTYHDGIAGTRIHLSGYPIGWLMTTINQQWTFSIDGYKPEKPFKSEQECKEAIKDYVAGFIFTKALEGPRRSAAMDMNIELINFYQDLASKQISLPADIAETINKNFDDLL